MNKNNLTKLIIKNLSIYAYHGVAMAEKELGGKYQVDIILYYDASKAVINDAIEYAINYQEVIKYTCEIIKKKKYNLIETIADRIINDLMIKFDAIEIINIKLRKFYIPIDKYIDYIEVEQHKMRN